MLPKGQNVTNHEQLSETVWNQEDGDEGYKIKCMNLKKVFPNGVAAVYDNSFAVKTGEVLGLLGPNGAGKSTTFNIVTMDTKRSGGAAKILESNLD